MAGWELEYNLPEHNLKDVTMAMTSEFTVLPDRPPVILTTTSVSDANPGGDIFGGWLLGQMDLAGGVTAFGYVRNRIVTVGVEAMTFRQPVFVGDEVSFYTDIKHVGRTSITIQIQAWVKRQKTGDVVHVTDGLYTYVSIGPDHKPQPISITAQSQI